MMEQKETITARGSGRWGGRLYDVELTTRETTWWSAGVERSQTITTWHLVCDPPAGGRPFDTQAERDEFVRVSFGDDLTLTELVPAPERLLRHPLAELVSPDDLASVTFVRGYFQLRFDGPPLNLYVLPWVYRDGDVLAPSDPGYMDAIVGQVGHTLAAVDELLDYGLVLDWDNGVRFAMPLDGTGLQGVEAAEFTGEHEFAIWTPGDPPVQWTAPPRATRSADDVLSQLQDWYRRHCGGSWEHSYGVTVETLDNPGWQVRVELHDTPLAQRAFERVKRQQADEDDWLTCWVANEKFHAACGPLNLAQALEVFLRWAD
jgi:hypothetical protein